MAYVSEAPFVLPEHERERYELMKRLFPALSDCMLAFASPLALTLSHCHSFGQC